MDLSKLPRLSKTPQPPAQADAPPAGAAEAPANVATFPCPYCGVNLRVGAKFCDSCGSQLSRRGTEDFGGIEAVIGIVIGLLILLFVPTTIKYASYKVFHTAPPFIDNDVRVDYIAMMDGSHIPYPQYYEFWSDLAVTSFAIALILEGLVLLFSRKPAAVVLALVITVSATLANLIYFVGTYNSHGLAPLSAIAVVIGMYMSWFQWRLLQASRSPT